MTSYSSRSIFSKKMLIGVQPSTVFANLVFLILAFKPDASCFSLRSFRFSLKLRMPSTMAKVVPNGVMTEFHKVSQSISHFLFSRVLFVDVLHCHYSTSRGRPSKGGSSV